MTRISQIGEICLLYTQPITATGQPHPQRWNSSTAGLKRNTSTHSIRSDRLELEKLSPQSRNLLLACLVLLFIDSAIVFSLYLEAQRTFALIFVAIGLFP